MPHWVTNFGRALALCAIGGLLTASLASGPRWLFISLIAVAGIGLILSAIPHRGSGTEHLKSLADAGAELTKLAGITPRLVTDVSPRGVVEAAAADVREATATLRAVIDASESRQKSLRALLDAIDEPVLATGVDGRIVVCNAAATELLGLSASRLLGRPMEEAFTQPDFARVHDEAKLGRAIRQEIRVPRADGPRMWETSAVSYTSGEGRGVVLTLRDVTDRTLALQVKTDFVANASHELRTPIAAIRVAVDTMESLGADDGPMREKLTKMLASHTHRLEEMVRDLLDLSKLESPESGVQSEPVSGTELATELRSMFERSCAERRLTLRFDFAPELESMHSDRNLLLLILGNLIDNARKFAFEDTEILVTGRAGDDRGVRFEVVDKGVGIPLGQQQRIFERFFQADAARTGGPKRGTGLGLSIVKHAVRRLGGTIRVNSVWHQGTTMTVELPECLDRPAATGSAGSPLPQDR